MSSRDGGNDSFDLFLDTICNTFGGVVFLAILVALLIQTRAIVRTDQALDESPVTAEQVRELMQELDEVTANYNRIVEALSALPPTQLSTDNREVQRLRQSLEEFQLQLTELHRQQAVNAKTIARLLAENAESRKENDSVPEELSRMQAEVNDGAKQLQMLISERQATVKLPRERATSSASTLMCLKNSEVFLAKVPGPANVFNNDQVTTRSSLGGGTTVIPKIGRGWSVNDFELRESVQNAKRNGYIITIAVWPDSYGDFQDVKKALIEQEVPYQLWLQEADEELTVFFGSGRSSVQ